MTDLSSFAVTGTDNASKQVSVDRWNAFLSAIEDAVDAVGGNPAIADVTGLQGALDAKQASGDYLDATDLATLNAAIAAKQDAGNYQPLDSDLTTIAASITAAGHALLDDADAAAQRTTLGLGTAATQASTTFASASSIALFAAQEWTPNFTAAGDLYIPAVVAMTIGQGNTAIGTGTLTYTKSTAAAPSTFGAATLPVTLEAGAWLKVAATSVTGFVATHLKRTA
jgi:hypothetical protein